MPDDPQQPPPVQPPTPPPIPPPVPPVDLERRAREVEQATRRLRRRRRWATGKNTFAGAALGFLITLLTGVLAITLDPDRWFFILLAAPLPLLLYSSSKYTCRLQPAAPRWIGVGVAIGGVLGGYVLLSMAHDLWIALTVALFCTGALPWLAYRAGVIGVHQSLGKPIRGVGDICAKCEYDLSSTPVNWPCPECGHEYRYPRAAIASLAR